MTNQLRFSPASYVLIACAAVLTLLPFRNALSNFIDIWNLQPEYSHGLLIPFLSGYLVWRRRDELRGMRFSGSWQGLWLITLGMLLWLVGDLATIYWIVQYGFLCALYGVILSLVGGPVFRRLWMPLAILVFMIPLPAFFNNSLSLQMQLVSSAIGVWFIRLAGISVFLEGNVIDLGSMQLQVAEACDGLRYMFPLMTLAFVMTQLFRAPLWQRIVLFVSSVPIAILMNSFRIGAIGITVEYWGPKMAQGLLHEFEGWVVFMFSTAALLGVAALLARLGPQRLSLRDAFAAPAAPAQPAPGPARQPLPASFVGASILVAVAALAQLALPTRVESIPSRASLVDFPTHLGEWNGNRESMAGVFQDALQLDDYLLADYRDSAGEPLNFYVAWYDSQRAGRSVHSPRACIPGGGWIIRSFERRAIPDVNGRTLDTNRVAIELDGQRQIVYYWFQQRGRQLTNEYLVKWYIFWDALTRNRTDGALVRVVVPVANGTDEAEADRRVARFAAKAMPVLTGYVPD
ncbi:MAG TPA: VPLPA-CTERM-specific exosortase XrtD [Steroidobacteraceae bacterium]|nr:VPLPA-CTERM-specific exosortase XrtD [Steroidobacteraceae bacterium]